MGNGADGNGRSGATRGGLRPVPWGDVLLRALVPVTWAVLGMAAVAALGLRLLDADEAGSLGPMTAATVALAVGGSVTPTGDGSAFGLSGARADTAIAMTPLGVGLVGALLLGWFFLRSLRTAGVVIPLPELLARAGSVLLLFGAMLGGLGWVGRDVITFDSGSLGLNDLPGGDRAGDLGIPGLGDLGDLEGLLPDRLGGLVDAKASVEFAVDTVPTLFGGLAWAAGVLVIAVLVSRRTPLPPGWSAVHRVVRPAASAVFTVLTVAVAAGLAAALYAAVGDDHPRRVLGAALLGTPNGVWLGIPLGLFVPAHGRATGPLVTVLPDPLNRLLAPGAGESVTVSRLAELDGRVWLLVVGAVLTMLLAGVLMGTRTPEEPGGYGGAVGDSERRGDGGDGGDGAGDFGGDGGGGRGGGGFGGGGFSGGRGDARFAARCALRLGLVTALALALLAFLTEVSADASLSVLGVDAFSTGVEVSVDMGMALLLGAVWGAGAGAAGALLTRATGVAGSRAAPLARLAVRWGTAPPVASAGSPIAPGASGSPTASSMSGAPSTPRTSTSSTSDASSHAPDAPVPPRSPGAPEASATPPAPGPYSPGDPSYRPPNPDTNPYLRVPDELQKPEGTSGDAEELPAGNADVASTKDTATDDDAGADDKRKSPPGNVHAAPTVAGLPYPAPPPPPPPTPPAPPSGGRLDN